MTLWLWVGFVVFVLAMLAFDLFVVNRKAHEISVRNSLLWTGLTIATALAFAGVVYYVYSAGVMPFREGANQPTTAREAVTMYLTAWILEYALSLDNLFVFVIVFRTFGVPKALQHRVLFWGILGVMVFRGVMIGAGAALVHEFEWVIYVLGGVLLLTAIKLATAGEETVHPEKNPMIRLTRRVVPVTHGYDGDRFFSRVTAADGVLRRAVTPLFLVLLVIETTDVVFAVDSIPAAFGVTADPFLVFTSNVFAIIGLRSLFFAVAAVIDKFHYLKVSLVFVLGFIGLKMTMSWLVKVPPEVSLGVVVAVLVGGIVASVLWPKATDASGHEVVLPPEGGGRPPE